MDRSDLEDIELDTDIEGVAERLDREPAGPSFMFPANRFLVRKAKADDKASRRGIKSMIKPDNAVCVLPHLPGPDERTHCLLRGDFVLCDLIPAIISRTGPLVDVHIATLGLSTANADCLALLVEKGLIHSLTIICSLYFQQVDKATTYREVEARLRGLARLIVERSHAKVICLPAASGGDNYVIEGSANLRSSDNLEQMTIYNDAETLAWHRGWMEELGTRHG